MQCRFILLLELVVLLEPVLSNDIRRCQTISRGRIKCENSGLRSIPRNIPLIVESLKFKGNDLGELNYRTFPTLPRLKKLYLIDNKITKIGNGTFMNMPNLEYILIYKDKIKSVEVEAFHGLPKLRGLRFYVTDVTDFPDYAFKDSVMLEEVFLHSNKLTVISAKLFQPLRNIGSIMLNHNQIHTIEDGTFKDLIASGRRGTMIVLADNKITTFQAGLLDRAKIIKIFNNPINCDCNLVIPKRISTDRIAACVSPPELAGKLLSKLSQNKLKCVKECDVPTVLNGYTTAQSSSLQAGEVLEVVCDEGFELSGSEEMICGVDGEFGVLHHCQEEDDIIEDVDDLTGVRMVFSKTATYPKYSTVRCPATMIMIVCQCVEERCGGALINDHDVCIAVAAQNHPATANATCVPENHIQDSYTFKRVEDVEHRAACRKPYNMTTCSNYIPNEVVSNYGLVAHSGPLCAVDCGDTECNMYIQCVIWKEKETRKSCELFGIHHGILTPPLTAFTKFLAGDNITLSCIDGYKLNGADTITCIEDDLYEPEYLPWCEKEVLCEVFGIQHAILTPKLTSSSVFKKGDIIHIECVEGYSLYGNNAIQCVEGDLYIPLFLPFCKQEKKECTLSPFNNVHASPAWTVPKGDKITLTCPEGFTNALESFNAVCKGTGFFEPHINFNCTEIPKVTCTVPQLPNMEITGVLESATKVSEGELVTFKCSKNYTPKNLTVSVCQDTGQFSVLPPICNEVKINVCRVPLIKYGRVEGYLPGDVIQPGMILNVICNGSYKLSSDDVSTLMCISEQYYQPNVLPRCVPKDVRCAVPVLSNGFYYGYRTGQLLLEGEQLTPGCHVGYTLSGPSTIVCDDGEFPGLHHFCLKPQLACVIPTIKHGRVITNGMAFKPPKEFPVLCNNGYETIYDTIACVEAPNMYDPFSIPECGLPDNGCARMAFPHMKPYDGVKPPKPGQTITVTCKQGYKLFGSSTITCGYGNQYTGEFPTCISYTGCEVPTVAYGYTDAQLEYVDNNTAIHITCITDYELYGDVEMKCVDGKFNTLVSPVCMPKSEIEEDCLLPYVDNGLVLVNGMINPGSTLEIICDEYYILVPNIQIMCVTGSTYKPAKLPECIDSSQNTTSSCVHLPIPNGYFHADQEIKTGDYATVTCQTNYNLVGSPILKCLSGSNYFTEVFPTCEKQVKKCSVLSIANAQVGPSTSINPGDKYLVQCNDGFDMEGDMMILCLEGGTTQPPPQGYPTCTKVKAPCQVPVVDNGNVIGSFGVRIFPVGKETWVSCDTGYEPSETKIRCIGDNIFTPPVPTCVMKGVTCDPPVVANGTMYGDDSEQIRPDTLFTVVCDTDFSVRGAQQITCQDDGQYMPAIPECVQTTFECTPAPAVNHSIINRPARERLVTDDRFSVECDEGYILNGTKYLACVRGTTYSDKLPLCVKKEMSATECRPLFIQNANIRGTTSSTTLAGNSVSIFCDEGYYMIGTDTLYCNESGLWDKDSPQCVKLPDDVNITEGCGMRKQDIPRIYGGSESEAGNYPWNVFIQFTGGKFCGGTVVNENWVMTAGHCFVKTTYHKCDGDCDFIDPSDIIAIKAGVHSRTNHTEAWQVRTAISIIVHPKFKMQDDYIDFDVGLIRVNIPFEYNNRVNRVCLPRNGNFVTNQFMTITGWGKTRTSYTSDVLQEVEVPYVPRDVCNSNISYKGVITDTMFCAGFQVGRKDACQGDSGGPIVYLSANGTFIQGGIVSWGNGCGQENFYGVYTNLARFYIWIMRQIVEN